MKKLANQTMVENHHMPLFLEDRHEVIIWAFLEGAQDVL
jgi:hypothetical protein